MLKKLLFVASAIGLVAVPTVASADPYYNSYGMPHSRSYGNVYVGSGYPGYGRPYGAYGSPYVAYGSPYGGYNGGYANPYGGYANPYGGYGNSYGYRDGRHRNNGVAGAVIGGVLGAVIGSAITSGGHRY